MKLKEFDARLKKLAVEELVKEFILKAPLDEVYSIEEVAEKLGLEFNSTQKALKRLATRGVIDFIRKGHSFLVYGSKKAIENLKKRYGWI